METKKSRPGDCSTRTAAETAAFGRAAISCNDCTTSAAGRQSRFISSLLSHGAENGVTLRHLESLTDLPGREIRRQIERFAHSMQHRAREILRTARLD